MPDDLFHCEVRLTSLWIGLVERKSFETSRQTWFFSFWDGILSINSYHMRCEHEKTFTGISASSLLLWNDFSLYWIDLSLCRIDFRSVSKSTSIRVKTTLSCNKRTPFRSIPDCIPHTMRCTLGSIQHGRQVTRKNVIASYILYCYQRNYSTWELEQGKTFSNLILIGKAEDVCGEWFFSSAISESQKRHGTGNDRSLKS